MSDDKFDDERNRRCAASDLARELGAIASGETAIARSWPVREEVKADSKAFATGLLRLIDERIAAAGTVPHNPPMDAVKVGDTFRRVGGQDVGLVFEVTDVQNRFGGPEAYLAGYGWQDLATLSIASKWARVRAVDVPKPRPAVEVGDRFMWLAPSQLAGQIGTVTVSDGLASRFLKTGTFERWLGVDVLLNAKEFTRLPREAPTEPGRPEPYRVPVEPSDVVAVGDAFLRLTRGAGGWTGGEMYQVRGIDGGMDLDVYLENEERGTRQSSASLLTSGDWQRVPAGYVLPESMQWHAQAVRLIAAYRASLADPETGLRGAHECMVRIAEMAGMEVPT